MTTRKIAFLRPSPSIPTNKTMVRVLEENFPEFEIEVFDVLSQLVGRRDIQNIYHSFREYWLELLLNKKRFRATIDRTPYAFEKVKRVLAEIINPEEYAFTFQMQSKFDGSVSGVPHFVYTDHTNLANLWYADAEAQKRLFSRKWVILEKSIYQNALRVFTRSSNITRSLEEQYGITPEKIHCVYAGSNTTINQYHHDPDRYHNKIILYVGIDWERKGGPTLLRAFELVRKVHPDATLLIVGAAPDLNAPNCEVIGPVPLNEVAQYYEKASLFCLPTHLEPFGIVFVEALAYGLPIVATKIGALPDMVKENNNGFLLEPGDYEGMAKAMIKLLDAPQMGAQFGANSYQLWQQRYNWAAVGKRLREHIVPLLVTQPDSNQPIMTV